MDGDCFGVRRTVTHVLRSPCPRGDDDRIVRRRSPILLVILVLLPLLVGFAQPRQQAALTLDVSAGYSGFYRRGQWTPVRLNVSNAGAGLDGYARVRLGELGGLEETTYRTPLSLPRGARKQVFLYISLENFVQHIQVEIVNDSGHIVAQHDVSLRMAGAGDALYAVVTASAYGAVDLAARDVGNGVARQVNWRVEDMPALSDALMGLDLIMFHDVDTGALRPEQARALTEWVLGGGHLIVAGGETWQRTTARLVDLLPVTLRGTVPLESAAPFGAYLRRTEDDLNVEMTATDSIAAPTARVLLADGDLPLIVRGRYGSGWVDFLAVDPNAEPLRSWPGKADLWYTLIASTGQQPSWTDGFSDWQTARDATLTTSSTVLPTFFQLCGFLLAYIVLVGPVNYLLLKRLDRREWAWVTIPVLITVFSVLAYEVGFNLRGNVPVVNRMSVIRAWPGQEQAQVLTLVGVQSPRRLYYDIEAAQGYALRTLPEGGIGVNVPVMITEGTRYVAQDILVDGGTVASLVASGYDTAPQLDAFAEWRLGTDQPPRITGTITNTTGVTLEDAVVVVKGEASKLGTLSPGQTAQFDIVIGPQSPGPLTLGTTYNWARPYTYGPFRIGSSYGGCFSHGGVALTIPDVMQDEQFVCTVSRVSGRQHEIRQRYRLLGALVKDQEASGGRGSGAYLFAWSREAMPSVALAGRDAVREDTTLYVFDLPVSTADPGQRVEVPPGLTTWTIAALDDPATMRDVHPEVTFQIDDSAQAVFQFMPLPDMRFERVDELAIHFQGQGDVIVALWNWTAQAWEPVSLAPASDTMLVSPASAYVGPENAVNVRVTAPTTLSYNRVQYIKVGYRGWLNVAEAAK